MRQIEKWIVVRAINHSKCSTYNQQKNQTLIQAAAAPWAKRGGNAAGGHLHKHQR